MKVTIDYKSLQASAMKPGEVGIVRGDSIFYGHPVLCLRNNAKVDMALFETLSGEFMVQLLPAGSSVTIAV